MNQLLSAASALFPFLTTNGDLMPSIIRLIFACASFTFGDQETPGDQCRSLRHHAMHEFVRLTVDFTDQLLVRFSFLILRVACSVTVFYFSPISTICFLR